MPQTIQRGATNAYFARVDSSILIPPYSRLLRQILDRSDVWEEIESLPRVDGVPHRRTLEVKARNYGVDTETFVAAVMEKLQGGDQGSAEPDDEERYRSAEYKAFLGERPPLEERLDFDLSSLDMGNYDLSFRRFVSRVVVIHRLRETRVLTGFSRIVPPEVAPRVSDLSLTELQWLPAIQVRGEGIFIVLKDSELSLWEDQQKDFIAGRVHRINSRLQRIAIERNRVPRQVNARMLALHTLVHLLIRQLTFDCGYDSSALRERLYVNIRHDTPMTGLLIYTASGDAEGTLGGLVRQGLPGRFDGTFKAALDNAKLCSSDPLCGESEGQGLQGLNLSACHACALLPETSCGEGNRLLDRALLIGTPDAPDLGLLSPFE